MPTYDCGHGCKITCPAGGGCIYWHDYKKCSTFCNKTKGKGFEAFETEDIGPLNRESRCDISLKDVRIGDAITILQKMTS